MAPDGLNRGWANQGGEDVAFFDSMIKEVSDDLCVDERQIYSLGFSYGGAMSYSLACARPKVFRAVAVLSGALLSGCSGGTEPVVCFFFVFFFFPLQPALISVSQTGETLGSSCSGLS